ncbi:bifunctional glycosyltransferase family 2 protein/CDP-glycerol:glycerophosphate glycerophosphotransferase [Streptomyces sp. NBC_01242]|uniref:bifunctional glycosyltransferase/CDP-glycerol:glycerophosphate glycerophosphotransferase n=1 Tax=unclassified Streptomyces TaxID=2593676 RepID=UPI0022585047|nr:glycosyltransferase [Streptomyces sp. NBC_01242]MCX4794224.1 bifunctional glycosyltransferase family 2 protein/CDP-glycerol:glycerophosphate glycerophosphotransferase [Streptomyces sp. NBC_01242]WSP58300.1 bifunctional glycosyltransferase family 2 protein/CDP-glycerol:glycerophosphate glycerophosphotransferase [Streptomyces sp. NBC_01241]WSU21124.1 bifunctional glycosyltransferase family 2 protein/CDP-glycerol:glycerophosphate glycerophosphotransferase [Streptomyces sp. NBC_01108]
MSSPADPSLFTVSVVVPAYNASATLGRALRSALAQTHRNVEVIVVDDASVDGTLAVVREFAAGDRRVQIIERPQNSGGVGAPRNNGIMAATGQYVMFLDADDELPLKACEELLASAVTTGSDITAGRALRVNLNTKETTVWQPQLYTTERTVAGLRALPQLFDDPIAAGKLYRLDFLHNNGVRFPEGVYYEDTYFSTLANYRAASITFLTAPVYRWMWERESAAPSITNRRGELRSIQDRVAVHQYTDAFLRQVGEQELLAHKAVKFLSHDLHLYARELRAGDERYRHGFAAAVAPYLRSLEPSVYDLCGVMERVRAFCLIHERVDLALSVSDYAQRRSVLSSDLVESDERVYWSESLLHFPQAKRFLDVTDLDLADKPLSDARLFNQATELEIKGSELHLSGYILNQFGRFSRGGKVELKAVLRLRSTKSDHVFPVNAVETDDHRVHYRATLDLASSIGAAANDGVWNLFVQVRHAGERATTTVAVHGIDVSRERYESPSGPVEMYETVSGNVALRPETSERTQQEDRRGTPWHWWRGGEDPAPVPALGAYRAAVVVHCHNDEHHLYEFLHSLAAQTVFAETQVVFADDGSTDRTAELLDNFAAFYRNSTVLRLPARGAAVAYEEGLAQVVAPYVLFARGRDILGGDCLRQLTESAVKHDVDVAIGNYDTFPGPRRNSDEPWKRYFGKGAKGLTDLVRKAPHMVFSTDLGNKLFRVSLLRGNGLRPTDGGAFADIWLSVMAMLTARGFSMVDRYVYFERDPAQNDSLFDVDWNDPAKARQRLRLNRFLLDFADRIEAPSARLIHRFVVRSYQPYLRNYHRIMNRAEIAQAFDELCDVYARVPEEVLLQYVVHPVSRVQHHAVRTRNFELFCDPFGDAEYEPRVRLDEQGMYRKLAADPVDSRLIRVERQRGVLESVRYRDGELQFEGVMTLTGVDIAQLFTNRFELVCTDGKRSVAIPAEQVYRRDRWRVRKERDWFGGWRACADPAVLAPLSGRDLTVTLRFHDGERHVDAQIGARLMLHRFKGMRRIGRDRLWLTVRNDDSVVLRYFTGAGQRLRGRLWHLLRQARAALPGRPGWRTRLAYLLSYPRLHRKNIWIIGERADTAQDNAYHLFRWIRENHPRRKVYYAINGDAKDRAKVAPYGHVLDRTSRKYRMYLLHAKRLINPYDLEAYLGFPELSKSSFLRGYGDLLNYRRVFLQHGVTYNDVAPSVHHQVTSVDLLLTVGQAERSYFAEHCGYGYARVAAAGFPRFDALKPVRSERPRILLMPTWRRDIVAPSYDKAAKAKIPFAASEYFRFFSTLLRDERLLKVLEQCGVELEFMPHYEIRPYLHHFRIDHPSVTVTGDGRDVQLAMRECSLLVTDYSSVFFDVAYMGTPIVYTPFDEEDFYGNHYKRGYYEFERDGFGPVCRDVDSTVREIIGTVQRNFAVEPQYRARVDEFFGRRDTSNSERVFRAIDALESAVDSSQASDVPTARQSLDTPGQDFRDQNSRKEWA